ncbi:MAG: B12-binding domain-containing radical SAM protein [Alphaproteobacteria bacterium]
MGRVFLAQASTYYPEVEKTQPLGLMYLASYLRERDGHECKIVDMKLGMRQVSQVMKEYETFPTDLVGISTITFDAPVAHEIAAEIKKVNPNAKIFMGGAHPTAYAEDVVEDPNVDFVVISEGEETARELIEALENGKDPAQVPGLVFRQNGDLVRTETRPYIKDLDSIPFPAWDLVPLKRYFDMPRMGIIFARKEYMTILTSRGCPYNCAYCHKTLGKVYRARSPENVLAEMQILHRDHGIREFVFMDDMFNLIPERVEGIARAIIDSGINVRLHFPNGFRGDVMDIGLVKLLQQAGMYRCMYAIETASPRLQKLICKNVNFEKTNRIIKQTADLGIMVHGVFMLGLPTETEEETRQTVDYALNSDFTTIAVFRTVPFKNSGLVELARADGIVIEDKLEKYEFHKTDVNLSRTPTEVLSRLKRKAYRGFYLNPRRLFRLLVLLPNKRTLLPALIMQFIKKALIW